jgi:CheY-like chemotaxis protein
MHRLSPMADPSQNLNGMSVLVVDDDQDARELVAYLLGRCGADVHQADGPTTALAVLAVHTPDVMISDIAMPGRDGYWLMQRVRSLDHDQKRVIPAIALTAFTRDIDRTRALSAGFDKHIPKPLDPNGLVDAILELGHQRVQSTPG